MTFEVDMGLMVVFFLLQDKYHIEHLKQVLKNEEVKLAKQPMPKLEEEWCSFHYLLQSSLLQMSEICMYHPYCSVILHILLENFFNANA